MEQAVHHISPTQIPHEHHDIHDENDLPGASWEAPEYHHTPKTNDWFWSLGIISITITIISFLLGDWIFGVLILVAAFALAMFAHRPPRIITVHMGTTGILVEKTLYNYEDIESFWVDIEENPAHPKILFKSKRWLMPYIVVPIGDMNPYDIADFLALFLPEVEQKEPLLMRLAEDLGF